jgi:hypothetical protein
MNETIMQKMRQLKFYGMANAFKLSIEDGRMTKFTGVSKDIYETPVLGTMPTLNNFILMLIATWRKTRYFALPNVSLSIMEKTSLLPEAQE